MNKTAPAAGKLKISGDTILKIAEAAAAEINGAILASEARPALLKEPAAFLEKYLAPIKVRISSDAAAIDISIYVAQGYKAHEVAKAVQENIKSTVQSMTGIAVAKVNVKIAGIYTAK